MAIEAQAEDTSTTEPDATTDPTTLTGTETQDTTPETQTTETTDTETPSNSFLDEIKDKFGADFASKWKDDDAAKKGLVEAARLVGQRNEEADLWRQFQSMVAGKEQQLAALLDGKQPEPAKPEPPKHESNGEWTPKSFDELRYLASKVFDETGNVRAGVGKAEVDRYTAANQRLQETAFDLAFNPDKVRERLMGSLKDELLQETTKIAEEKQSQQQVNQEFQQINERYAAELFADEKKEQLTSFGEQVREKWNRLLKIGAPATPATYREAIDGAMATRPKPNPTKPTNPNAVRKPALPTAPNSGPSLAERMAKPGFQLRDLVRDAMEKQNA